MRIVLAVLAGFFSTLILALGTDALLKQVSPGLEETSSFGLMIATLIYTQIYASVGGYVTGRIGRPRALLAAMILAGIAFAITLANLLTAGSTLPLWLKAASLVLLIPCTLAGAWFARVRTSPA